MTLEEARALLVRRHRFFADRIKQALELADEDVRDGSVRSAITLTEKAAALIDDFDGACRAAMRQAEREK